MASIGHIIIKLFAVYCGMLIISKYTNCDPVYDGVVEKYDQMFPYYVMDVARSIPGLPGLFIVGTISAALSTVSSGLNCLSATVYEGFIRPHFPNATERQASNVMKIVVFIIGCACLGLVFIAEKLGGIFSISIAFCGSTYGTLLALFTMGMLCPNFNTTGALWGIFASLSTVGAIIFGAQFNIYQGNLKYPTLPFNIEGCSNFNESFTNRYVRGSLVKCRTPKKS
jgi:Na+/proline symporter